MKLVRYKLYRSAIVIVFFLVCIGCQQKSINEKDTVADESNEVYFRVRETILPNPDNALIEQFEALEEGEQIREISFAVKRDIIYRVVQIVGADSRMRDARFLQKMEPPYEDWLSYDISANMWDEDKTDVNYFGVSDVQITQDQEEYIILNEYGWDATEDGEWERRENRYYLGTLEDEDQRHILRQISNSLLCEEDSLLTVQISMFTENDVYLFQPRKNTVTKCTKEFELEKEYTLPGIIWGLIQNPVQGTVYWYGIQNEQFGIWSLEEEKPRLVDYKKITNYYDQYIHVVCTSSDTIYLTDEKTLWRIGAEQQIEEVCDFINQGYLIDNIYAMSETDETVYFLTQVEGEYCLLAATEGEKAKDKQEIILDGFIDNELCDTIARFNRISDDYHITMKGKKEEESFQEFYERLQLEAATGKTPDLYAFDEKNAAGYAKNGYLQSMEELVIEPETFWPEALETAKINGIQYGIPYMACLSTSVYSGRIAEDRTTWTMEEMIEAVKDSQAELLADGMFAYKCIVDYIMNDKYNTDYIDWEQKESHLKSVPFLNVMKFAKEYLRTEKQYTDDIEFSEFDQAMKEGIIASLYNKAALLPSQMNFFYNAFDGNPSFIGMPRNGGSGIYINTNNLYMSSTSDNKEGIRSFLEFLLSESIQLKNSIKSGWLPIRLEIMEEVYKYYKKTGEQVYSWGISYRIGGLTDEQIEQYRELLNRAEARPDSDDELYDIMCEELVPYLDGYRTLEEAADIMDNRVQLYLNERK